MVTFFNGMKYLVISKDSVLIFQWLLLARKNNEQLFCLNSQEHTVRYILRTLSMADSPVYMESAWADSIVLIWLCTLGFLLQLHQAVCRKKGCCLGLLLYFSFNAHFCNTDTKTQPVCNYLLDVVLSWCCMLTALSDHWVFFFVLFLAFCTICIKAAMHFFPIQTLQCV